MAYLPREERRAAIIDAALSVLASGGFAALSARAVATELGGSPGLIHQHFASMDELAEAAWDSYVERNLAEFERDAGASAESALAEFFANHLGGAEGQALDLWADAWGHAQRTPAFAPVFERSLDGLVAALGARLGGDEAVAERAVLLALALAGMRRVSPNRYDRDTVGEMIRALA